MPSRHSKDATFSDLSLSRRKAIRFLERVQRQMLKAAQSRGGEIVARMELTQLDDQPNYSIERPNGEQLLVVDGRSHKPLAGHGALQRSSWSEATMSFEAVSELAMSLASEELNELSRSHPADR